jgi:hypothetical protein
MDVVDIRIASYSRGNDVQVAPEQVGHAPPPAISVLAAWGHAKAPAPQFARLDVLGRARGGSARPEVLIRRGSVSRDTGRAAGKTAGRLSRLSSHAICIGAIAEGGAPAERNGDEA